MQNRKSLIKVMVHSKTARKHKKTNNKQSRKQRLCKVKKPSLPTQKKKSCSEWRV